MKIHPAQVIKQLDSIQKKQNVNAAEKTAQAKEGDKVVFSKELQQVRSTQNDPSVDTQRQARLQAVKEQIADGSYAPDRIKVAESLLKYITESRHNG